MIFALFGFKIYPINKAPANNPVLDDGYEMQKKITRDLGAELTIFDIGAFDGGTALKYQELFPESKIFSFEPFPDSFSKLVQNTKSFKNIIPINKGIGELEGFAKFNSNSFAPTNSLLATHESGSTFWGEGLLDTEKTIEIELTTIDNFVEIHGIKKIDILKMDVQGAEYLVLQGAKKSFEKGIINMIYTEIITLPTYKGQLNFDEMINLMRTYGFMLFNLYNYSLTDGGQLRQVDAIFLKSTPHNKK